MLVVLLVGVPLALLASYSFRESSFLGVGAGPTFDQYKLVFEDSSTLRIMLRTIAVALGVATAVTALAFVVAYALTFRLTGRKALVVLGVIVASGFASFIVRIFAWGSILGTNGLVNGGLEAIGVIDEPLSVLFFGYFAVGVTMAYLWLPLAVLVVFSAMQGIDRRTVEASRDLGAGRWGTVFKVVVPQARAGLVGAFVLTAIFTSADFVTPRLVGGPRGLTIGAVVQDLALSAGDLPGAAALALSFLAVFAAVLGLLALVAWGARALLRPAARRIEPAMASVSRRTRSPLARISLSVPVTALALAYLVIPTILVILFSFNAGPTTGLPITGLTTDWYPDIVGRAGFTDSLSGSLIIAGIGVTVATAIAVPFAFALRRARGTRRRLLWAAVFLPFVIPGVLLGSAVFVAAEETGVQLGLGATAAMHVVLLVSEIVIIVYARLTGIDEHLVEAARDLGSSAWGALRGVTLPLLLPAIIGAALLATAFSLDEIFVTTFTIGSDNTLPVWLFGQSRQGFTPGINGVGVMLLFGTLFTFALAVAVGRRTVLATGEE